MQHLSPQQANAVMDIVVQCKAVSELWNQRDRHERNVGRWATPDSKKFGERIKQDYKDAVVVLTDLYMVAFGLQVEDSILDGVLNRNLPDKVVVPLTGDTQEFNQVESD